MAVLSVERQEAARVVGDRLFDAVVDGGARSPLDPVYLHQALVGRVGLLIQLSSWRVYAGAEEPGRALPAQPLPTPVPEEAPVQPGPFQQAEESLWRLRSASRYPATVLRLGALYGPGIRLAREWYVVDRLRRGRNELVLADGGGQILHRLYVDNAVHAVISALDHPHQADGGAFNVADSDAPTAARLVLGIAATAGRRLQIVHLPSEWWPCPHPWACPQPVVLDLYRLRARLGYQEPIAPVRALEATVRWLMELADDEAFLTLAPYWERFGACHDLVAEERALARWHARRL